jgi:hypothetical protein
MKPKPFSWLNHLTVPVAICSLPGLLLARVRQLTAAPLSLPRSSIPGSAAAEEPLGHRADTRPSRTSPAATARRPATRAASAWSTAAASGAGAPAETVHDLP